LASLDRRTPRDRLGSAYGANRLHHAFSASSLVYLDGEVKVAVSGGGPRYNDEVRQVLANYAANCGRLARVQIGKAAIRLADQLRKLFP
jgi:hypothetical protein